MANQPSNTNNDEIDLGQLFDLVKQSLKKLIQFFYLCYRYLKKNIITLILLVVLGLVSGYFLNKLIKKATKIEIILKPNFESKDYLYTVLEEISSNVESENVDFFDSNDFPSEDLKNMEVEIESVNSEVLNKKEIDFEYLEILQKFENNNAVLDVVRAEILETSSLYHKITVRFKNKDSGLKFTKRLVELLNSNEFYLEYAKINKENIDGRIESSKELVNQIDRVLEGYIKSIGNVSNQDSGKLILEEENNLDVKGLLQLKNSLTRDIESNRIKLLKEKNVIGIIDIGAPQEIIKPLLGRLPFMLPLILVFGFIFFTFIRHIDRIAS